jgi:hypothetical protein
MASGSSMPSSLARMRTKAVCARIMTASVPPAHQRPLLDRGDQVIPKCRRRTARVPAPNRFDTPVTRRVTKPISRWLPMTSCAVGTTTAP